MPINNPIDIFLINPNIISYCVPFIKYLSISKILLVSTELEPTEKKVIITFYPVFFQMFNCKMCYLNTVHNLLFQSLFL